MKLNPVCNFSPRTHQVVLVGHADGDSRQWPHGNLQSGNFGPVTPSVTSSRVTPSVTSSEMQSISNDVPTLPRRTTSVRQYFNKHVSNQKHHHDVIKQEVQVVPGILTNSGQNVWEAWKLLKSSCCHSMAREPFKSFIRAKALG